MKTSALFMDIVCDGGTPSVTCGFCGRFHFAQSDEFIDDHRVKSKAEPTIYIESSDDSIGLGYLDGKTFVWNCPCDAGAKYEAFIWSHRHLIARYIEARAKKQKEEADSTLDAVLRMA